MKRINLCVGVLGWLAFVTVATQCVASPPQTTAAQGPAAPSQTPAAQGAAQPQIPASQGAAQPQTPTSQGASLKPQTAAGVQPKVITLEGNLEADDLIRVEVDHLAEWAATNNPAKLVPYLNGLAIRGNYPQEIHISQSHLHFHLHITAENKKAWVDLLGSPEGIRRPVAVSVGLEDQSPFDTAYDDTNKRPLTVISPWYGVIALIIVLATFAQFLWLARTTSIIRDPGPKVAGKLRPYSLGRTQMAFWFFLIYASYVVIWLITDALDTITGSLLGLMGISAGTALSEALIDSSRNTAQANKLQDLTAEKQTLEQSIPELQSQIASINANDSLTPEDQTNRDALNKQLQDNRTRLAQIIQQIEPLAAAGAPEASRGFLRDVLSDETGGYSFHRFQIFAWTIVLGIIFVSSVYNGLTMPEFSTTLLGLMGISSGTYIGFKFPEQQ